MTVYTVLVPTQQGRQAAAQAILLPDRFSRAAFLFGPLWLLWHRVWRGLIGYATIVILTLWAARWLGLHAAPLLAAPTLLALYLGLEGPALRRQALERRGFQFVDVVSARNLEEAERAFFSRWADAPAPPAPPPAPPPQARPPARQDDVLGLFPEPGPGQ